MLKKYITIFVIFITLFFFTMNTKAYDFIDPNNESKVNGLITQIYDTKQQYEDLVGSNEETTEIIEATSNAYWWPIGSKDTTESNGKIYAKGNPEETVITSTFGYRDDVTVNGVVISSAGGHGALDIANYRGNGVTNIIASKSGVVVYPTAGAPTSCPNGATNSNCGGGYGNYIIIQHTDGNYTLYAHLHPDSILVKAGESVEQGQVIAKMGSTGFSSGTHLHFEIRKGQNSSSARVDPLEGSTQIVGDEYLVVNIGDGVRTVGSGVTLESNPGRFKQYGIDIDDYPVGTTIPISIVDQIKIDIVNDNRSYVESLMANNSITLQPYQIDALVSQIYNIGNIVGFVDAYKQYGDTIELYNNWMYRATNPGSQFEAGLSRRRRCEWAMFHEGVYVQDA